MSFYDSFCIYPCNCFVQFRQTNKVICIWYALITSGSFLLNGHTTIWRKAPPCPASKRLSRMSCFNKVTHHMLFVLVSFVWDDVAIMFMLCNKVYIQYGFLRCRLNNTYRNKRYWTKNEKNKVKYIRHDFVFHWYNQHSQDFIILISV